jgi:general secretion pathway protein G
MTVRRTTRKGGFTLVEILIVVIILGILAAIVIPQFTSASQDARKNSLTSQLQTIRSQIELYKLQHLDKLPPVLQAGTGWTDMTNQSKADMTTGATTAFPFGPYLQSAPTNTLNGATGILTVSANQTLGAAVSSASNKGFVFNTANGKIWATSALYGYVYDESSSSNTVNDN